MTTTPAASEDGDGHGTDGRGRSVREAFFILFLYVNYETEPFKWSWKLGRFVADPYICFMFFKCVYLLF